MDYRSKWKREHNYNDILDFPLLGNRYFSIEVTHTVVREPTASFVNVLAMSKPETCASNLNNN